MIDGGLMTKYEQVKNEIYSILQNSPINFEQKHAELALKWVLKLRPDADEALKIAALAHDIERAYTKITEKDLKDFSRIDEFKKEHSKRSASYISAILGKYDYPRNVVDKVRYLVENHEFGGDGDLGVLTDADSLAYFDYNIPFYMKRNGRERAKEKIKFMYKRLSSKARELVDEMKFEDRDIESLVNQAISEL